MKPALRSKFLIVCAGFAARAAFSEAAPEVPRRNFGQFFELAEREGFQLGEQRGKIEFAKAREDFAASQGYPGGNVTTLLAPVPGATGNGTAGITHWDNFGPLYFVQTEIVQPLYTFGAISSGKTAARAGREAEENLLARDRWTLRNQIAEIYYGYQMAFEFAGTAESTVDDLKKALEKAEKISARDADKLRIFLAEAQTRLLEARKGMDQARLGMAWKTGRLGREVPRWDQANLVVRPFSLGALENYKAICLENRPELRALKFDIEAKTALAGVERGLSFPTFFLVARGQAGWAKNREAQHSPFSYDPSNDLSGVAGLGMRWNVNFMERSAKLSQARADLIQAEARAKHYESGIFAEVEKNYLDVRQVIEAVKLRAEGAAAAKRVFRDLVVGYTLGTNSDAKALLESLGQFVMSEKSRLESIYAHNVAIAKLEQSIGKEI